MREDDLLALVASRMTEPRKAFRFSAPCSDRRHVARLQHLTAVECCAGCLNVQARKLGVCRANAAPSLFDHMCIPRCHECGAVLSVMLSDDGLTQELESWDRVPRTPSEWGKLYVLLQSLPQGHPGWDTVRGLVTLAPTVWDRVIL